MAKSTSIIIGTAWIDRTAKAAENNNSAALDQLRQQYIKEVKRANQRARTFDAKGMSSPALIQYRKNLDGNFLSQSKNLDIDTMVKNMKRAEKFLKAKTGTIRGEMEAVHKSFETMSKPKRDDRGRIVSQAFIKPPPEGMSKLEQEKKLARFLKNKNFDELKKNLGSGIIAQAAEAINQGVKVGRLSRLYNEYVRSGKEADLDMVWNAFISGEKHI
jgi:hypothetical protein